MKRQKTHMRWVFALSLTLPLHQLAQSPAKSESGFRSARRMIVTGGVFKTSGEPVAEAAVVLKSPTGTLLRAASDAAGHFSFRDLASGSYTLSAESQGLQSLPVTIAPALRGAYTRLVLNTAKVDSSAAETGQGITFSDEPSFIVSGVTDWTAVGGHGSDATLRTSEDLARATATLKAEDAHATPEQPVAHEAARSAPEADPKGPQTNLALGEAYLQRRSYQKALGPLEIAAANEDQAAAAEYDLALVCRALNDLPQAQVHIQRALLKKDSAKYHGLAGELAELQGDPYSAVQHMAQAARLDPSEENYFAWGSELLLHRAVLQAAEIFQRGADAHPASMRMQTGLGSALFAEAHYKEASERLCRASDMQASATEPYLLLGKVDESSPEALPCVEQRLARFVRLAPRNAGAHYFYAMYLLRRNSSQGRERFEALLLQAVKLVPTYAPALLQLGILATTRQEYAKAGTYYKQAIAADNELAEAHYRLANVYEHTGQPAQAATERALHLSIRQRNAEAVEQDRRKVKQFLIVLQQPTAEAKY